MPILAFKMPARVASRSRASTKGRGGRKGGPDRRSSGPERRRVLKPQNYSTTPAIKAWRPPVPEPLPPAPLLGPKELLALGLLVGAQVWAWLNGRPRTKVVIPPAPGTTISGTVPPPGNTVGATLTITAPPGTFTTYGTGICTGPSTSTYPGDGSTLTNVKGITFVKNGTTPCGAPTQLAWIVEHTDHRGTVTRNIISSGFGVVALNASYTLSWNHPSAIPYVTPTEDLALPDGYEAPQIEPAAVPDAPAPLPLPLPAPSTVPQVEPEVQPAVAPVAPDTTTIPLPQVVRTTTVVQQQQLPGAITVQNGALPAPTPAPVPTTDPGSIIPWPGAAPIPGKGPAPAPTMEGLAQELGRIERKLEVMNTPAAPGNLIDRFELTDDLIRGVIEALFANGQGTTYTLDSPCEVDEETGEKLPPVEVQAPGDDTYFGVIRNRLDALAELLQIHKNLKQPNCRPKKPQGEFVTVNFEQIDPWPENDL
jgi:hypothetical protein